MNSIRAVYVAVVAAWLAFFGQPVNNPVPSVCGGTVPPVDAVRIDEDGRETPFTGPAQIQQAQAGVCKWNKSTVVLTLQHLYPVGGISRDDIERSAKRARRKVHRVCRLRVRIVDRGPADIVPFWGNGSWGQYPCQHQPALASFCRPCLESMQDVPIEMPDGSERGQRLVLLDYYFTHEAMGHGLGLPHGGDGGPLDVDGGGGFDVHGNPAMRLDRWMKRQYRMRYGRRPVRNAFQGNPPGVEAMTDGLFSTPTGTAPRPVRRLVPSLSAMGGSRVLVDRGQHACRTFKRRCTTHRAHGFDRTNVSPNRRNLGWYRR